MITCVKCKEQNPANLENCQNCGHTLLPGETFGDRITIFIAGLIGMGISIGMLFLLEKYPDLTDLSQCLIFARPEVWFIGIVGFPITGLIGALRKTPMYKKYENRAQRHQEIDPEQALVDLSEALQLAPEKEKAGLLKQRSALFNKLGREKEALQDQLEYIQDDEAHKGTSSFAQTFGLDGDTMVSDAKKSKQKQLVDSGKVTAIGYCVKCAKAVVLNEKNRCPEHPKAKPYNTTYILSDDVEQMLIELTEKSMPEVAKTKKKKTIFLIILSALLVICCIIPLAMGLLSNLFERF